MSKNRQESLCAGPFHCRVCRGDHSVVVSNCFSSSVVRGSVTSVGKFEVGPLVSGSRGAHRKRLSLVLLDVMRRCRCGAIIDQQRYRFDSENCRSRTRTCPGRGLSPSGQYTSPLRTRDAAPLAPPPTSGRSDISLTAG